MVDWSTLANVGTATGTALLAVATFSATRSANNAARSAERSLLDGLRPILVPTRWEDPAQKVRFVDGQWIVIHGGRATLEARDDAAYLVISLRNVGRGVAVLHGWDLVTDVQAPHREPADFHQLVRDIYIAPGDGGFCQIAVREAGSDQHAFLSERAADRQQFAIDVLYGDVEGGQRMITRAGLSRGPAQDADASEWAVAAGRHWNLDRPDPRLRAGS
jgi:hypothetical protein